jgi:hypothetical protein
VANVSTTIVATVAVKDSERKRSKLLLMNFI